MAARVAAARAARRHLAASAIGFGTAVAIAKAFMVPQEGAELDVVEGDQKRELKLVQVVFRHGARTPLGQKYWPELGKHVPACCCSRSCCRQGKGMIFSAVCEAARVALHAAVPASIHGCHATLQLTASILMAFCACLHVCM